MPHPLVHFAIHADDVERARAFYERVFGWQCQAFGPPGFYMIYPGTADSPSPHGSLQARSEPLAGTGMRGFECTIGTDDLDATRTAIEAAGGTVTLHEHEIPGIGRLLQCLDTEGNAVTVMQYREGFDHRAVRP